MIKIESKEIHKDKLKFKVEWLYTVQKENNFYIFYSTCTFSQSNTWSSRDCDLGSWTRSLKVSFHSGDSVFIFVRVVFDNKVLTNCIFTYGSALPMKSFFCSFCALQIFTSKMPTGLFAALSSKLCNCQLDSSYNTCECDPKGINAWGVPNSQALFIKHCGGP